MMQLKEAFSRWAKTLPPPGSKGLKDARRPLWQHAGVDDGTVGSWLTEGKIPNGEVLFRVLFFFESLFGETIEFFHQNDLSRFLMNVVGSRVMSINDIVKRLGFADASGHDSVVRVIRGGQNLSPERQRIILDLVRETTGAVESVRAAIKNPDAAIPRQEPALLPMLPVSQAPSATLTGKEEALVLVSDINLRAAMGCLERLVESTNPAVRQAFRVSTADFFNRFRLLASALTSEQAREARIADGLPLKGDVR